MIFKSQRNGTNLVMTLKKGKGNNMNKIIILILLAFMSNDIWAQEAKNPASLTKKEKKELEQEKEYQLNRSMLDNRDFVLEANYLQDRFGNRHFVNSLINFVAVDSMTAIIQVGSDFRNGPNGVGGVTAKGRITKWELKENKKNRSFDLIINVMTNIGIYDLQFSIGLWGSSTVRLTGLTAGQLTFEGDLEPYSQSRVYEGRSL
jgi:hypothetical protein